MTIRPATFPDIPDMMRIRMSVTENRLADPSRVQPHHCREMLSAGIGWVCEMDDSVAGFAIPDTRQGSIWALFVDPAHERKGIGRRLHDTMVEWLFAAGHSSIWLTTDPDTRAEQFYRAAGWRAVAITEDGEIRFELTPERFSRDQ
jgi:GNAT superfamily N-acetyltransferase